MPSFYNAILAQIHNLYYSDLAVNAAHDILNLIGQDNHLPDFYLIDLGCGSGNMASILTEKGIQYTGVDYSEEMIKLAREKAPHAKFEVKSLFDYNFPTVDMVCAIGESINYLFDNKSSYSELQLLFQKIYKSLSVGGFFLFDVLTTSLPSEPSMRYITKGDFDMIVEAEVDLQNSILTRKITLFFNQGQNGLFKKEIEIHRQFLVEEKTIFSILETIGFQVKTTKNYHNIPLRQGHLGFICKK